MGFAQGFASFQSGLGGVAAELGAGWGPHRGALSLHLPPPALEEVPGIAS